MPSGRFKGSHRDMVHFSEPGYTQPGATARVPGMKDGKWERIPVKGRRLDKDRFEAFKTPFYELQGWDTASGFPARSTLASLGPDDVADELEAHGRLGARAAGAEQAT